MSNPCQNENENQNENQNQTNQKTATSLFQKVVQKNEVHIDVANLFKNNNIQPSSNWLFTNKNPPQTNDNQSTNQIQLPQNKTTNVLQEVNSSQKQQSAPQQVQPQEVKEVQNQQMSNSQVQNQCEQQSQSQKLDEQSSQKQVLPLTENPQPTQPFNNFQAPIQQQSLPQEVQSTQQAVQQISPNQQTSSTQQQPQPQQNQSLIFGQQPLQLQLIKQPQPEKSNDKQQEAVISQSIEENSQMLKTQQFMSSKNGINQPSINIQDQLSSQQNNLSGGQNIFDQKAQAKTIDQFNAVNKLSLEESQKQKVENMPQHLQQQSKDENLPKVQQQPQEKSSQQLQIDQKQNTQENLQQNKNNLKKTQEKSIKDDQNQEADKGSFECIMNDKILANLQQLQAMMKEDAYKQDIEQIDQIQKDTKQYITNLEKEKKRQIDLLYQSQQQMLELKSQKEIVLASEQEKQLDIKFEYEKLRLDQIKEKEMRIVEKFKDNFQQLGENFDLKQFEDNYQQLINKLQNEHQSITPAIQQLKSQEKKMIKEFKEKQQYGEELKIKIYKLESNMKNIELGKGADIKSQISKKKFEQSLKSIESNLIIEKKKVENNNVQIEQYTLQQGKNTKIIQNQTLIFGIQAFILIIVFQHFLRFIFK